MPVLLTGCGGVLSGPDDGVVDQPAVTAASQLPVPVASDARVGAAESDDPPTVTASADGDEPGATTASTTASTTDSTADSTTAASPQAAVGDALYVIGGEGEGVSPLVTGSGPATDVGLRSGPLPDGGRPVSSGSYAWTGSSVELAWSDDADAWVQQRDGEAALDEAGEPLTAASVLFMDVPERPTEDADGAGSPEVPVGSGAVTLLRDGRAFTGSWSREDADAPATFTGADGGELLLDDGDVWLVLMRQGEAPTLGTG